MQLFQSEYNWNIGQNLLQCVYFKVFKLAYNSPKSVYAAMRHMIWSVNVSVRKDKILESEGL